MITLKQLKTYVKKHGHAKLAAELGYKTNQTIQNWIVRKSIPHYMYAPLERVLNDDDARQDN